MKIQEVLNALERFAPLPLQEDYDNAGLQVGLTEADDVSGALLCLDITEDIIDEAEQKGCNLIVSHHPLIFHRLRQISDRDMVQRCVMAAIRKGITIASMHTNLDNAPNGVNYLMAERLGLTNVSILAPKPLYEGQENGSGTVGNLPQPMEASLFINKVKETFHAPVAMTNAALKRPIRRVALCGGAGSFLLSDALRAKADAFITGEMHYHEYFGHEQEIQIIVIGHYETEQFTPEILRRVIENECPGVRCEVAETITNPIHWM